MDEQREESAISPAHIRDLHQQAEGINRVIHMGNYYLPVDLSGVGTRNFSQHFPEIATQLRDWNDRVQEYKDALSTLNARHDREALRPIDGMTVQMAGVMLAVAAGTYSSPEEVTWLVQTPTTQVHNLAFIDGRMQQDITVCTVPSGLDALTFAERIQRRLTEVRAWPEAMEYRETVRRLLAERQVVARELEAVQLNHALGGSCDTCRPPKKGRRSA
jgi:hypothetical protein